MATTEAVLGGASVWRATGSAFNGSSMPLGPTNVVFVARAGREPRDEQFPHAGAVAHPHRMAPASPRS